MDFIKAVVRDVIIYTLPFIAARTAIFPMVSINSKMQRSFQKNEEESDLKNRYKKYQNFSLVEKIDCVKDIVSINGFKGIYEKFENYIVPFTLSRIAEGFIYFPFMRFCLDVMEFEDPLYLLTGLAFFFVNLVGSFFLKFFADVLKGKMNFKSALALLSPSNTTFWRQYEIELGCYHAYGLIQGYIQLITFWYLKPGLGMEIILFAVSRLVASFTTQPLVLLVQWASKHEYDHSKLLRQIAKREGYSGLFAGSRDILLNEIIFSLILIPGCHLMASLV